MMVLQWNRRWEWRGGRPADEGPPIMLFSAPEKRENAMIQRTEQWRTSLMMDTHAISKQEPANITSATNTRWTCMSFAGRIVDQSKLPRAVSRTKLHNRQNRSL